MRVLKAKIYNPRSFRHSKISTEGIQTYQIVTLVRHIIDIQSPQSIGHQPPSISSIQTKAALPRFLQAAQAYYLSLLPTILSVNQGTVLKMRTKI